MITRLTKQNELLENAACPALSYPVSSANALQLLTPSCRDQVWESVGNAPLLHTWNEVLRRAVVFKWMAPPAGSFMSELFAKHQISFASGHTYSSDHLQRLGDNYTAFTHWSWHQPRIDGQQARLAAIEHELELLKGLYAEAIAELGLRRAEESAQNEVTEFANVDMPGPPSSALSVIDYGPQSSFAGEPFNPQPNGQSAIWMRTSRAPLAQACLVFDGVKLETVIVGTMLTAAVPTVLLMRPRTVAIKLKGDKGELLAQPVKLVIREK